MGESQSVQAPLTQRLADVVGDERQAADQGLRGDQHVIGTDRQTPFGKVDPQASGPVGILRGKGQDLKGPARRPASACPAFAGLPLFLTP